jgi:hypothetical protein
MAKTKELKELNNLRQQSTSILFGKDQKNIDTDRTDLDQIKRTINDLSSNIRKYTGPDIIDFWKKVNYNQDVEEKKKNSKNTKNEKKYININDTLEKSEELGLNQIFAAENRRILNYYDFRRIVDMIPQMSTALSTYVDNIISPDDFTKQSLDYGYTDSQKLDKTLQSTIDSNLEFLIEKYKVEEKTEQIITKALGDGDYFLAIIPLKKDLERILSEGAIDSNDPTLYEDFQINSSNLLKEKAEYANLLSNELEVIVKEEINSSNKERTELQFQEKSKKNDTEDAKKKILESAERDFDEVISFINENVLVSKESSSIYSGDFEKMINTFNKKNIVEKQAIKDKFGKGKITKNTKDFKLDNIKGSYLKVLEPERVVKIEDDSICFGYLYFEENFNNENIYQNLSNTNFTSVTQRSSSSYDSGGSIHQMFGNDANMNNTTLLKKNFIYRVFVKGLAKKLKYDFLENNPQFGNIIYSLLKNDFLFKKKVRVTFFAPNEVQHFGDDSSGTTYYNSLFRPVIFAAKLYIAVLTSTLMHRIVRAPSKRIFYLEGGLDNNDTEMVNNFIRQIKSQEITIDDIAGVNISNVLSAVSNFTDIFVPTIDREKPIEVETIEENSPSLQDEFLEFLLKTLNSGVGIPHAFVNDSESVQFARSLTMENAKFLRSVIRKSKKFTEQFTELLQKLYINEFDNYNGYSDETGKESEEIDKIDIENIFIKFPSPAALNMTNLNEQINNSSTIVDQLSNLLVEDENDMKLMKKVKLGIAKNYISLVDWDIMADILTKAKQDNIKENLTADAEENPEGSEGGIEGEESSTPSGF